MSIPPAVMVNWLTVLGLSLIGVALSARYAYSRSSVGMALFAVFFGWHAITTVTGALAQTAYLSWFVQQQTGPNTWTAPVLYSDGGFAISLALLVVACIIVGNGLPAPERTKKASELLVAGGK